jgi:site-specific recombinase XerD
VLGKYQAYLLAGNHGTGTVRLYVHLIERLRLQYPDLLAVSHDDLLGYLAVRRATHAAETRKSMRTAFRSFYGWAHRAGFTTTDPSYDLPAIRIPATLPRVAPDTTVQLGLITADVHLTAMIMLARFGCLRLTELTTLHTRHRESDLLRITGKGEKQRLVPANDDLLAALLTLEREQGPGYYFPGRFGGAMHPQSVNKIITRHLGVNPHSLRHAGATAAYKANGDLEALRLFLGHSSIATTQRYLHVGMDSVRRIGAGTAFVTPVVNPHNPDRIFGLGRRFVDAA